MGFNARKGQLLGLLYADNGIIKYSYVLMYEIKTITCTLSTYSIILVYVVGFNI